MANKILKKGEQLMANNFSVEQAKQNLAAKTGIPLNEFVYGGISKENGFIKYKFYKGMDKSIVYTVLSEEEVNFLEENNPTDFAP